LQFMTPPYQHLYKLVAGLGHGDCGEEHPFASGKQTFV
jgi:hypothetical protein